ncbi:MAG: hypothetical protein ACFE8V_06860 [Promethearchaeota archaeon]
MSDKKYSKTPSKLLEIQKHYINMLPSRKLKRIPLPYYDMESRIFYSQQLTAEYIANRDSISNSAQISNYSLKKSKKNTKKGLKNQKPQKKESSRKALNFLSRLINLGNHFRNIKTIAWIVALFGISFISIFLYQVLPSSIFPYEIICGFVYFLYIIYFVLFYITIKGYVVSLKRATFLLISPLLLFVFISYFLALHLSYVAVATIPIMMVFSALVLSKRLNISEEKYVRRTHATKSYSSVAMAYHQYKMPIITLLIIIFGGVFIWNYFFAPFLNYIPPILITISIFLFTFQNKKAIRLLYR